MGLRLAAGALHGGSSRGWFRASLDSDPGDRHRRTAVALASSDRRCLRGARARTGVAGVGDPADDQRGAAVALVRSRRGTHVRSGGPCWRRGFRARPLPPARLRWFSWRRGRPPARTYGRTRLFGRAPEHPSARSPSTRRSYLRVGPERFDQGLRRACSAYSAIPDGSIVVPAGATLLHAVVGSRLEHTLGVPIHDIATSAELQRWSERRTHRGS